MGTPIIYGPELSTYVRTVRLAFEEKGASYKLEPVNVMAGENKGAYLARHPFGKVPAFEHDGVALYETDAIIRYLDQVVPGKRLTPEEARDAARMNQVMGIVDAYGYGAIIGKIVWQRLVMPMLGGQGDAAIVEEAKPMASTCLKEFERIKGSDSFLAGREVSLADLFLAPIFFYLTNTPDAEGLLSDTPGLRQWWSDFSARPSMIKTQPNLG